MPRPSDALAPTWRQDVAACERLLRAGSKSFFAASRLLPRRLRAPVAAVYAFCRVADDLIDEGGDAEVGLLTLRERLDAIYAGAPRPDPVDRAFSTVVRAFGVPRQAPDGLLEGFAWDARGRRYETLSDVIAYAARVASTVGVMMTLLMGRRAPRVLARACDLGVAMQLTNIARDVGEDGRAGRVYLPQAWLREAGVAPDSLRGAPRFTPGLGRVVERLLQAADQRYALAERGIAMLPRDCQPAIRAARLIYADLGRVIRRRGGDSVSVRAVTSTPRKLWLAARAVATLPGAAAAPERPPLREVAFLLDGLDAQPPDPAAIARLAGRGR